jgi:hypothetical protein
MSFKKASMECVECNLKRNAFQQYKLSLSFNRWLQETRQQKKQQVNRQIAVITTISEMEGDGARN